MQTLLMKTNKNKVSLIPVKGLLGVFENTTIIFNAVGIELAVSLNIEPEMKPYLRSDHVFKGDKFYIYKIQKHIPSRYINTQTVQYVHDQLLNNCMRICREAKMKVIEDELRTLKKNGKYIQSQLKF